MRKISGILCLVLFLTSGLVLGQEQQQEQGQPLPAPYIVLFGTQWDKCGIGPTQFFDDLGIKIGIVYVRDRNYQLGIVDLLVIGKDDKEIPIAGWKKSYTDEEQGFVLGTDVVTKTRAEDEALIYKTGRDQDGNLVLVLFHLKKGVDQPLFVKYVDLKKFVEENFKDQD